MIQKILIDPDGEEDYQALTEEEKERYQDIYIVLTNDSENLIVAANFRNSKRLNAKDKNSVIAYKIKDKKIFMKYSFVF